MRDLFLSRFIINMLYYLIFKRQTGPVIIFNVLRPLTKCLNEPTIFVLGDLVVTCKIDKIDKRHSRYFVHKPKVLNRGEIYSLMLNVIIENFNPIKISSKHEFTTFFKMKLECIDFIGNPDRTCLSFMKEVFKLNITRHKYQSQHHRYE